MSELKRTHHSGKRDPADEVGRGDDTSHAKRAVRGVRVGKRKRRRRLKTRRRIKLSVLPALLTLGNGVCGLAAIAIAVSVALPWEEETKLLVAGVLIFGGMLFDALDGSAARMTGQESQFGAELDSLCDAVTFGVAPAVMVWRIGDSQALPFKLSWAIGVLFALCVLIRLARYNVESNEEQDSHENFDGLPSPAAAGAIAAFAIALPEISAYANDQSYHEQVRWLAANVLDGSQFFMAGLALVLAYLMVSRFQYPHLFRQLVRGRRAPNQIGQAMFVLIGALILHWLVLPIAFCYYAFAPPIRTIVEQRRRQRIGDTSATEPSANER